MAKVDILVPCHNYARYLEQCMRSVLTQSVTDIRVLIIDDCSADESVAVAERLAREDPRVSVIAHRTNWGHIATFNEGIAWAQSDYFLLLSADDALAPGALRRACAVLDAQPEVVLVCGDSPQFRDAFPQAADVASPEVKIWAGQDYLARCCAEVWNPISTPSAIVRTAAQKAVGGYRPYLPHSGDLEMWLRLATHGDVAQLSCAQAFYRVHDVNMHFAWFHDFLVNDRELRRAFESFFQDAAPRIRDCDALRRRCSQRLAERGIWWAYQKLRRLQLRGAVDCLRYASSVWHDRPEQEASLMKLSELLAPVRYAVGERQRRRRVARPAVLSAPSRA
ncbi:glycosyltransferase involved in cell wall biosynthesis [Rhodoblastus acidophilus]|uniref:glycosyltransferase family 2 protein n=1 Tax=Rhodoblastus acidophilus TaxID=1074 RepID=UPI00222441C6|nr:glycosyltransferase family 2 protein [Rhodoblastus acidophilus]MCW2283328.1 glycosyltransferase involved in cell wall biosynthesis [Rhodoblastus acidophilus]MCW2332348.1 glycosyltransferase involved in cell wall biosynthesis [Rhodoblastus acidophilus]